MKKSISLFQQTKKISLKAFLLLASLFIISSHAKAICNLNANFNYTVNANGVVNFASTSTGTTIATSYQWYFYPGSATGNSVTHTFQNNGTYPVTLYLNDTLCFDSVTVYVTVNTSTCSLNGNFNYTVNPNGVVNFASTSTGTTATTSYQWYFYPGSSTGVTASHIYPNAGTYPVTLVTSNGNCYDSTLIYITVNTASCNLNANFSYTVGANGVVNFASTSTGTNVSTTYQWYFSPGSATGANVTHTYNNNGVYGVSLFASDSSCYDSLTVYITVNTATCNLNAGFTYTLGANGVVNFASTSTGTNSGTTYQWYFFPGTASGPTSTHTFPNNGTYPVTLWVNNGNCSDSITGYISINTTACNLNANFNYTVNANGSVNFANTSTGTTIATFYQWYFYPGTASGQTTTHNYTSNGTYPVKLYLSDTLCTDSITKYITISNQGCNINAGFTYTVAPNGVVHFASTTTGASPFATYYWWFGDLFSATGSSVSHTYTTPGQYVVTLHVFDSLCNDSTFIIINTGAISGIKNNSTINSSIKVYPNPNNGEFNVTLNGIEPGSREIEVLIYNTLGQIIFKNNYENTNGEINKKIRIEDLPDGAYILRLNNGSHSNTSRLIIQK